jgi:hypothetical protein
MRPPPACAHELGVEEPSMMPSSPLVKAMFHLSWLLAALCFLSSSSSAQTCVQPPAGLVSWWPRDGNAQDIIGPNDGTLQGGATFAPGMVEQAFSLNGLDAWVDLGTAVGNFGTGDFSVDFWVKFNSLDGEQVLIEKYIERFDWTLSPGWGITKLDDNSFVFFGKVCTFFPPVSPPNGLVPDTWYHVAATRTTTVTGTTARLYFDGQKIGSCTEPTPFSVDSTASLKLGHRGSPTDTPGSLDDRNFFLNGLIDEVELYNRALSTSDIQAVFNAGSLGKCKDTDIQEVTIDIKPGSSPNSINPKSNGVIPVAILTTDTFDATTVDPLSVRFGPEGAKEMHKKGHIEDVNKDGEPDLVLHFKTQATGITCGDTSASLTGETVDGDPIQGFDSIKTVGCNKDR